MNNFPIIILLFGLLSQNLYAAASSLDVENPAQPALVFWLGAHGTMKITRGDKFSVSGNSGAAQYCKQGEVIGVKFEPEHAGRLRPWTLGVQIPHSWPVIGVDVSGSLTLASEGDDHCLYLTGGDVNISNYHGGRPFGTVRLGGVSGHGYLMSFMDNARAFGSIAELSASTAATLYEHFLRAANENPSAVARVESARSRAESAMMRAQSRVDGIESRAQGAEMRAEGATIRAEGRVMGLEDRAQAAEARAQAAYERNKAQAEGARARGDVARAKKYEIRAKQERKRILADAARIRAEKAEVIARGREERERILADAARIRAEQAEVIARGREERDRILADVENLMVEVAREREEARAVLEALRTRREELSSESAEEPTWLSFTDFSALMRGVAPAPSALSASLVTSGNASSSTSSPAPSAPPPAAMPAEGGGGERGASASSASGPSIPRILPGDERLEEKLPLLGGFDL